MVDLFSYLKKLSDNSLFKAELSTRGGFITFGNSGKRGGVKYFQIGLDNIIQTLKDINDNIDVFQTITDYVETPWRDNGSTYFNDPVANANSTVQTKPLFSTLSKVIIWANQPLLDDVDPDRHINLSKHYVDNAIDKLEKLANSFKPRQRFKNNDIVRYYSDYRSYLTAIKSKPFLLLSGISGTGKSRIVRELARACWDEGTAEYEAHKPKNFEMIQVKPNWHDSSELIGYVSRVSGKPEFVAGDFLKFAVKAWEDLGIPYFLCLDEMNLAPVEQYFAEYLSVIESRKNKEGRIVTDAILKKCNEQWYFDLTAQLTNDDALRKQFNNDGITIPQNLIVIGTVNMDETTFSFSRKVLDRAMTIEMNEVDLYSGLEDRHEKIGKLGKEQLIATAVEGVDVYSDNKDVCDKVLDYLKAVNDELEGTPFKVAYRTRNDFLLYVVNNLPYNKDEEGNDIGENYIIANALDEITSMKILSRIEGDEMKIGNLLDRLKKTITDKLNEISGRIWTDRKEEGNERSVSLAKITEMKERMKSGYTSFWS